MDPTINQALQEAVDAHQAGRLCDAEHIYTSILQSHPQHPEANYNMGLLAMGMNKMVDAMQFFKLALKAKPSIAQHWFSYIEALIRLERIDEAKAVLAQAITQGAKGHGFDKIERKLSYTSNNLNDGAGASNDKEQGRINILNNMPIELAIKQARKLTKEGNIEEAKAIYQDILVKFPYNSSAKSGLKSLSSKANRKLAKVIEPTKSQLKPILDLYGQGNLEKTLIEVKHLQQQFPYSSTLHNICGSAYARSDQLDEAIISYKAALEVRPTFAEAHNNLGIALREKGELDSSIKSYKRAIKIDTNFADAYYNLGISFRRKGDLDAAIENFKRALKIKPSFVDCFNDLQLIDLQISDSNQSVLQFYIQRSDALRNAIAKSPKHHIYQSIANFMAGNFDLCKLDLENFSRLTENSELTLLSPSDKIFCEGYFFFLNALLKRVSPIDKNNVSVIYHIGESHCLSYAHTTILKNNIKHLISPRMVVGAKAYHFSDERENSYKAVARWHLNSIPKGSNIFISIGEIDCRMTEGILPASEKTGKTVKEILDTTISGYISWFVEANKSNDHVYHFFNIPAPFFDPKYTPLANAELANLISQFNNALFEALRDLDIFVIDVYKYTVNEKGFSNGTYHCDGYHLDNRIIPHIESQILDFSNQSQ